MNDRIRLLRKGSAAWSREHVISRGGKATGKNWTYLNIKEEGIDGLTGIDFVKDVEEWRLIEDMHEVNLIPSERHSEIDVNEGKAVELEGILSV